MKRRVHVKNQGSSASKVCQYATSAETRRSSLGHMSVQRQVASETETGESPLKQAIAGATSGQSIDSSTRAVLEPSFGFSFEDVRIHADGEADQLCKSVQARAFTTGRDIFFQSGLYDPNSSQGLQLLVHELTHTVQQASGSVDCTDIGDGVAVSHPFDRHEQEAVTTAQSVMDGLSQESHLSRKSNDTNLSASDVHSGITGGTTTVVQGSWFDDALDTAGGLWDDASSTVGTVANVGGALTSGLSGLGNATVLGGLGMGGSIGNVLADYAPALAGVSDMSKSGLGKFIGGAGKAAGALGVGTGLLNFATATNNSDRYQAGADTAASAAGFLGPIGSAFSGGYAGGQLLDQAVGGLTGESLSDRGGDALFDALGPGPGLWLADKLGI
ncbi:MAG: hypothetical protein NPIRA04_04730 [Nitrospirales bacterium]|nr:MAG: hypothetical protein NPIRA04_04730 [Nitrospirales bacterium]